MLCGVAGSLDPALGVGDVVIGVSHIQHDYGTQKGQFPHHPARQPAVFGRRLDTRLPSGRTAGGPAARGAAGPRAWSRCRRGIGVGRRTPAVHFGSILTGDGFVNSEGTRRRLREQFKAHAVEMEGGAVAQVARRWGDDIAGRQCALSQRPRRRREPSRFPRLPAGRRALRLAGRAPAGAGDPFGLQHAAGDGIELLHHVGRSNGRPCYQRIFERPVAAGRTGAGPRCLGAPSWRPAPWLSRRSPSTRTMSATCTWS